MRALFGCLAALLCVVSVVLAARYGYKGTDTEIDAVISAIVFGLIALCACLFDAAAVRLWFMGHCSGAAIIGVIAAAALVVTFTNSLGAIASRSDSTQAERNRTKADEADSRAELARITRERDGLAFTPTTDDAVKVTRDAVTTAERIRLAKCGNGDQRQRGPNCRQRETEEQAYRSSLASVLTNKDLTERAAQLDADAARVRAKLAKAPKVQNANPLGAALEQMIGATAAALTAWQQAIVAGVFELCLVGVMVIFELLGHVKEPAQQRIEGVQSQKTPGDPYSAKTPPPHEMKPSTALARRKTVAAKANGSVKRFVSDHVIPTDGERIEIKTLMRDYRAWCAMENVTPLDARAFLNELEKLCRKLGIETKVGDDQRAHCLNVKMATTLKVIADAAHPGSA
jgi:hypothetical protein